MLGEYFTYNDNIYKIRNYSSYSDCIEVTLVKLVNPVLCKDAEHAKWLQSGDMWPDRFFKDAKVIPNGKLLYAKG